MKKQILNLGRALSKKEQKTIFGGIVKPPIIPEEGMGFCIVDGVFIIISCESRCPDGTVPFCTATN